MHRRLIGTPMLLGSMLLLGLYRQSRSKSMDPTNTLTEIVTRYRQIYRVTLLRWVRLVLYLGWIPILNLNSHVTRIHTLTRIQYFPLILSPTCIAWISQ